MPYTGPQALALVRQELNIAAAGGNWTTTELIGYINMGLSELALVCPDDLLGPLALNVNFSVASATAPAMPSATIPNNVYVYRFMLVAGTAIEVVKTTPKELTARYKQDDSLFAPSDPAEKSHYYTVHDLLFFYPRYSTAKNFNLWAVKKPDTLPETGSTEMDCHEGVKDVVIHLAVKYALEQDGRLDAAMLREKILTSKIISIGQRFNVDTQEMAEALVPGQPAVPKTS